MKTKGRERERETKRGEHFETVFFLLFVVVFFSRVILRILSFPAFSAALAL
jgi:hypothetical protein